jgi:hypothetical protein
MNFEFTLCSNCHRRYRLLHLDPGCKYDVGPIPFNTMVWPDEHPDRIGYFMTCCEPCRESIRLLVYARTHMWRYGKLPEALVELWSKAQNMIPDWPGFKRLSLNEKEMRDLSACPEQFDVATATVASRPDPFLQYMEKRSRETPGLVRPGAMSNLGLDSSGGSRVMRCPKCREFVDAAAKKCRFCNSELGSKEVDSAVAERVQEKVTANQKEAGRNKTSALLSLAAVAVYFLVPAARPVALATKLIIVLLLIVSSLASRLR